LSGVFFAPVFLVLRFCNSQSLGFDKGGANIFVPKPAGRVSASLRKAGLRLARLKPDFFANRTQNN